MSGGPSWLTNKGASTSSGGGPSWLTSGSDGQQAQPHHSGGLLGTVEHVAHVVGQKADLAGRDLKGIPGGIYDLVNTEQHLLRKTIAHPLADPNDPKHGVNSGKWGKHAQELVHGLEQSTVQTVKHPLRDPFQTALLASSVVSGAGGAAGRVGALKAALADGGTAGDVARAAISAPPLKPRLIKHGDAEVPLQPSKNAGVRAVQGVHDKVIQHALDTNPDGRLAAYATKRIGGSIDETARYTQRLRDVPAQMLDRSAKALDRRGKGRVQQAALELTSTQTLPHEAAAYHEAQAAAGVNPDMNRTVAKLYKVVGQKNMVHLADGHVVVNEAAHPELARADAALARVQGLGDQALAQHEVRTPDQLAASKNAPGQFRAGATFEAPTPGKLGKPSQTLLKAQARVGRLETLHERAIAKASEKAQPFGNVHTRTGYVKQSLTSAPEAALKRQHVEVAPGPKTPGAPSDLPARGIHTPTVERLGSALSVARDDLQRLEQQAANRVKPTGIIGGEGAREGRGFVSYKGDEPKAPRNAAASSAGPVVGEAKPPISSHGNQGVNISLGRVPKDITGQAARHYRQIARFANTADRRDQAIRTGSIARRTSRDILVKVPGEEHAAINGEINQILGRRHVNVDELNGLNAALDAFREDTVPGVTDKFASDRATTIGAKAPDGYRWVDKNVLGDIAKPPAGPRTALGRAADNVNSAVTAATVYFKIGHVGTRFLTNAATNIIQGSAAPKELGDSVKLWHALSEEDKARALAAAGQHGFAAMPHEGQSWVSKVAGKGSNWWAKHADAPFRFNSIAYEARKAGFDTPAKFRQMLDYAENPDVHRLNAADTAKVDWVLKRANREQIAYDRLSDTERRFISRGLWFYSWLRGTVGYTINTALEHPVKAQIVGSEGQQGRDNVLHNFGDVPSYDGGLIKLGGGATPTVTDLSTFSPFSTPADILNVVARPGESAGFLNPVYGAANSLINGVNQYGSKSTSPVKDAAAELFSPTPEAQILTAFLNRHKSQGRRSFPQSPELWGTLSPLLRALLGPATPREANPAALASAAARERSGR